MAVKTIVIAAIILGCAAAQRANKEAALLTQHCLNCICEASTDCMEDIGCSSDGDQYLCGPYAVSYGFWKEGGSPGANPSDPLDFEKCLNNKPCAEAAIKNFMKRFGRDCNGDGSIDCYDWALIHKAGPGGCKQLWPAESDFYAIFKTCYEKL